MHAPISILSESLLYLAKLRGKQIELGELQVSIDLLGWGDAEVSSFVRIIGHVGRSEQDQGRRATQTRGRLTRW